MSSVLPVPFQPQLRDGYCLPACVSMILNYWGSRFTQERLVQLLGTSEVGTPISRVQRLVSHGWQVECKNYGGWQDIQAAIQRQQPLIVAVHAGWLSYSEVQSQHALVIVGCQEQSLTALDPATNGTPIELSQNAFMIAWIEMESTYAVIRPA